MKLLLARGVEIRAKDIDRRTAFHLAAESGHLDAVKLLLDRGAEIEARNAEDRIPLHLAALSAYVEVVKQLLEDGANTNTEGREYGNALRAAAYNGNETLVQLLVEKQDRRDGERIRRRRAGFPEGKCGDWTVGTGSDEAHSGRRFPVAVAFEKYLIGVSEHEKAQAVRPILDFCR